MSIVGERAQLIIQESFKRAGDLFITLFVGCTCSTTTGGEGLGSKTRLQKSTVELTDVESSLGQGHLRAGDLFNIESEGQTTKRCNTSGDCLRRGIVHTGQWTDTLDTLIHILIETERYDQ